MKWCPSCNAVYEDSFSRCPACGAQLEAMTEQTASNANSGDTDFSTSYQPNHQSQSNQSGHFMDGAGSRVVVNGEIADVTTQQLYQSKFTKIVRALFSGEPYQLSHTTFITIFRVEEHTNRGYPERAADFTMYGTLQNLLSPGDDVTIQAKRKRSRYIARRVYNHSTDSYVRATPNIPAGVVRMLFLLLLATIIFAIAAILSIDYSAVGRAIVSAFLSILPTLIVLWVIVSFFIGSIKRKK